MIPVFLAKYLIFIYPLFLIYLLYKKEIKIGVLASGAGVIAKILEVITGYIIYIPRPFIVDPDLPYYRGVISDYLINDASFFSAHAATSFAFSAVIYLTYDKKIGRALLIIAGFVSLGRVLANVHYPIDVIVGGLVGYTVGLTLSSSYAKLLNQPKK
jgi:undecaprenyl-diphosphatase